MKIAYFDCFAGAAGDMIAAAMLDAGLDEAFLAGQLASLGIEGLDIKVSRTKRCGLRAVHFEPVSPDQHVRHLTDITKLINNSKIADPAKQRAIEIFESLARAEAGIHGGKAENVHFHEIGAVDSIVDIVSACIGLETLAVNKVYCSPMSVGGGVIKSAHGLLPVPAPATVALLKKANAPIIGGPGMAELLTPTGAAILANFADEFGVLPAMKIESIGYGAGTLESDDFPNMLRLIIGESASQDDADADCVCLLETNIDDATSERIGFVLEKLLEKGALDVFTTAIGMKHNRPAVKVSVISAPADRGRMESILFEEGLTLGIRKQLVQRSKLAREFVTVKTEYGEIRVKTARAGGKLVSAKPEYASCAAAAKRHNVALAIIQQAVMNAFDSRILK
jgi:uncharacterized protein (TIGR00299 family) protein